MNALYIYLYMDTFVVLVSRIKKQGSFGVTRKQNRPNQDLFLLSQESTVGVNVWLSDVLVSLMANSLIEQLSWWFLPTNTMLIEAVLD